jgi:hypothetical protein
MIESITVEDVGKALAMAAARDQRTVGEGDIFAWYDDLNAAGVTFPDVRAALTRFYVEQSTLEKDQRFRVTTPDVIRMVRKIRADRLENFLYEPGDPDEPGEVFAARKRQQLAAVASGKAPAPTARLALEGGPAPKVLEALRGVLRAVPDDDADEPVPTPLKPQVGAMTVECPRPDCKALVGRQCKHPNGKLRKKPHPARITVASGGIWDPEAERAEEARRRAASAAALEALRDAS